MIFYFKKSKCVHSNISSHMSYKVIGQEGTHTFLFKKKESDLRHSLR